MLKLYKGRDRKGVRVIRDRKGVIFRLKFYKDPGPRDTVACIGDAVTLP